MELGGLHHVTAVTSDAPRNLDFYTNTLGLRLVKKTVNQDDVSAYHLFYGDEAGSPGTEVTFFDWAGMGPNLPGTGSIVEIGLRVPDRAALDWWAQRFDERGLAHSGVAEIAGHPTLRFADPEGQRLALVAGGSDVGFAPWRRSPVPLEHQIRGLNHVTLAVDRLAPTARVLTDVLELPAGRRLSRGGQPRAAHRRLRERSGRTRHGGSRRGASRSPALPARQRRGPSRRVPRPQ